MPSHPLPPPPPPLPEPPSALGATRSRFIREVPAPAPTAKFEFEDTNDNRAGLNRQFGKGFGAGKPFEVDTRGFSPRLKTWMFSRLGERLSTKPTSDPRTGVVSPIKDRVITVWRGDSFSRNRIKIPAGDKEIFPFKPLFQAKEAAKLAGRKLFLETVPILGAPAAFIEKGLKKIPIPEKAKVQFQIGPTFIPVKATLVRDLIAGYIGAYGTPIGIASIAFTGPLGGVPVALARAGLISTRTAATLRGSTLIGAASRPAQAAVERAVRNIAQRPATDLLRKAVEIFPGKIIPRALLPPTPKGVVGPVSRAAEATRRVMLEARVGKRVGGELAQKAAALPPAEQEAVQELIESGFIHAGQIDQQVLKRFGINEGTDAYNVALETNAAFKDKLRRLLISRTARVRKVKGREKVEIERVLRSTRFEERYLPVIRGKFENLAASTQQQILQRQGSLGRISGVALKRLKKRREKAVGIGNEFFEIRSLPIRIATGLNQESNIIASSRLQRILSRFPEVFSQAKPANDFWVQVPKGRQWGVLQRGWMNPQMFKNLEAFVEPAAKMGGLAKTLVQATSNFKSVAVGWNFFTRSRNLVTDTATIHSSGVPMWRIDLWVKAAKEIKNNGPAFREAKAQGLGSFFEGSSHYQEYIDAMLKAIQVNNLKSAASVPFAGAAEMAKLWAKRPGPMSSLGIRSWEAQENWTKMIRYLYSKELGKPPKEALRDALFWGLDYGDNTPFVQTARRFLIPFITYPTKIGVVMSQAALQRPVRFQQWRDLMSTWNIHMAQELGIPIEALRDELEAQQKLALQYNNWGTAAARNFLAKLSAYMLIPLYDPTTKKYKPYYVDASGFLPTGQFLNPRGLVPFGLSPLIGAAATLTAGERFMGLEFGQRFRPKGVPIIRLPAGAEKFPEIRQLQKVARTAQAAEAIRIGLPFAPLGPAGILASGSGQKVFQAWLAQQEKQPGRLGNIARNIRRFGLPAELARRAQAQRTGERFIVEAGIGAIQPVAPKLRREQAVAAREFNIGRLMTEQRFGPRALGFQLRRPEPGAQRRGFQPVIPRPPKPPKLEEGETPRLTPAGGGSVL